MKSPDPTAISGSFVIPRDEGPRTIDWVGTAAGGRVRIIDQTVLPHGLEYKELKSVEEVWEAIRSLRVRGAPAIGIAAAMGVVVGLQAESRLARPAFDHRLTDVIAKLRTSRPTAVNLFWALDRMARRHQALPADAPPNKVLDLLLDEARLIATEDGQMCRAIGVHGERLVHNNQGVLTHCNAGGLATSEYGTALAVLYTAHARGKRFPVFAGETRPLLQGSRLTAWELRQRGLDVTVICDSMAAQVMREGKVGLVIVGADRIAANGDTANKIGTYGLAVLAKHHNIPFYVAAPSSTFDLSLPTGAGIPIEQRDAREVTHIHSKAAAPDGVKVYNPAFDVTPGALITGIITEKGVITPVTADTVRAGFAAPSGESGIMPPTDRTVF
jgi:methylthioribose-1-phosphate isomerase